MMTEQIFRYRDYDIIYNGHDYRVPIDNGLAYFNTEDEAKEFIDEQIDENNIL